MVEIARDIARALGELASLELETLAGLMNLGGFIVSIAMALNPVFRKRKLKFKTADMTVTEMAKRLGLVFGVMVFCVMLLKVLQFISLPASPTTH